MGRVLVSYCAEKSVISVLSVCDQILVCKGYQGRSTKYPLERDTRQHNNQNKDHSKAPVIRVMHMDDVIHDQWENKYSRPSIV